MTAPVKGNSGFEGSRILVVDDDPSVRRAVARALAIQGHLVVEADGTDAALAMLAEAGSVPLVVTDLHMPGRDGIALLAELHEHYPDTAVIMLTGDADVTTAVACLKMGAVDYLPKPVLVEEVRARVARVLEQRHVSLELRRLQEAYQVDLETQVRELSRRNEQMFLAQVQMAVTMLEAKDPYTRGHSGRVAQYAVATARQMGLAAPLVDEIRLGGELHDVGKIGTRDAILQKAGPLTAEEFAEMRRHTLDGEAMLEVLRTEHPHVLDIVRSHHEHMDGRGFPDGLEGVAIPLSARIVSVVDAFDAMTSTRTYREMRDSLFAFSELERHCGTQFDPDVVLAFTKIFPEVASLIPSH